MKNSLISIIVPVYNASVTLERCLRSLVSQSYKNIEIICVDDGSTDASLLLLETFANLDKRIKIIKNTENKGVAYSRNIALKHVNGEYIMWCDSDDWYEKDMCKEMYEAITNSDTELAICNAKVNDEGENIRTFLDIGVKNFDLITGKYVMNFVVNKEISCCLWNKIFKKSLIDKYALEFPLIDAHEDYIFVFIITMLVKEVFLLNKHLYNYTVRPNSTIDKLFEKEAALIEHIELRTLSTYVPQILKEKHLEFLYPIYNELYLRKISECFDNLKAMSQIYVLDNIKNAFLKIFGNSTYSNSIMNICFACDNNYVEQLATLMMSIFVNSSYKSYFNFFILDGGISKKNKKKIEKFKKFNCYIEFIPIDFDYINLLPNNLDYISSATYFRYFISELKPDLDRILYLDCDMIVRMPLQDLYNIDFDDNYVIAVKDGWYKHPFADKHKIKNYFNAGMLLINNKKWKEDNIAAKLVKNTILLKDEIPYGDQDVLNYTFNKKIKLASIRYNTQSFSFLFEDTKNLSDEEIEDLLSPVIVHYTNREKPWNSDKCIHPYSLEYFTYCRLANKICKFRKKPRKIEF